MSGERASRTRQRLAEKICHRFSIPLDMNTWQQPGERACSRCDASNRLRPVRMALFLVNDHWRCTFTGETARAQLPRTFNFALEEKVTELARRGGGLKCLADVQALEHGLRSGRGNVTLFLAPDQYDRLAR